MTQPAAYQRLWSISLFTLSALVPSSWSVSASGNPGSTPSDGNRPSHHEIHIALPGLIAELEAANPEIKVARQRWEAALAVVVMKRIAAPQVGGVFSAMILTLFVIPPVYVMWRWWREHGENGMSG